MSADVASNSPRSHASPSTNSSLPTSLTHTRTVSLAFLFVNNPNIKDTTLNVDTTRTVLQLKQQLFRNWPTGLDMPDHISQLRLICGGHKLDNDLQLSAYHAIDSSMCNTVHVVIVPPANIASTAAAAAAQSQYAAETAHSSQRNSKWSKRAPVLKCDSRHSAIRNS